MAIEQEQFDSIGWDDFWNKKFHRKFTSDSEAAQTALDDFEVCYAEHRVHAERLIANLQRSHDDLEFAAENWIGTWTIYARTSKQRKLSGKKMDRLESAAGAILRRVEAKYPLSELPSESPARQHRTGCLTVILCFLLLAIGFDAFHFFSS